MSETYSKKNAPLQFCPGCFKNKRDWGFRYHRLCSQCFGKQQKQRIAKLKRRGQYNNNVELTSGTVVTSFVKNRLRKQAQKAVPSYTFHSLLATVTLVSGMIIFIVSLISSWGLAYKFLLIISAISISAGGFIMAIMIMSKRENLINAEVIRLATKRQEDVEAARLFYGSPEWKLLREQIMQQHQNICVLCGKTLPKTEITIDHIMPRSKFPEKALEATNMQILCRSCNSRKGAKIWG